MANGVGEQAAQGADVARFKAASRKAHDFSLHLAAKLGKTTKEFDADVDRSRREIDRMIKDVEFFKAAMTRCRDLDLSGIEKR
jgi:hypothetical protein